MSPEVNEARLSAVENYGQQTAVAMSVVTDRFDGVLDTDLSIGRGPKYLGSRRIEQVKIIVIG